MTGPAAVSHGQPTGPSPRVSVVMPFLNAARFIREAIESVVAQTFDNWELLLVDDGSSDGCNDIARDLAALHPGRIRLLEWPDGATHGASAARNHAIENARGDLLAFLDADDVWLPGHLANLVPIMDAWPEAGSVITNTLFWYSWDPEQAERHEDYMPRLGIPLNTLVPARDYITACWRGRAAVPCTCGLLVRRDLAVSIGGFEPGFRRVFTDQAFYTKLFLAAPVYVAAGCWNWYRQHPDSSVAVAQSSGELHDHRVAYLRWSADYLGSNQDESGAAATALRNEIAWNRAQWLYDSREASRWIRRRIKAMPGHARNAMRRMMSRFGRAGTALRGTGLEGKPHFGPLHSVTPLSREYGFDRGQPIDRYYIEGFLARNASDIHGVVLEAGDDSYSRRFGGSRIRTMDILHVNAGNARATIIGDLADGDNLPSERFDCIVLTQTLHLVWDMHAAVRTLHRMLRPGGTCLVTVPGISQIEVGEWRDTWFWSLTELSAQRLFAETFGEANVTVEGRGNVLAACAFLQGVASEELRQEELDHYDPYYPVSVLVRAARSAG